MDHQTKSVPSQRAYPYQVSQIKVRLWPKNRERIDKLCEDEIRTITQAVNILIDEAFNARDAHNPGCKEAS